MKAEQQYQQRGHQRPAADASHTDERSHKQACDGVKGIIARKNSCPL
jgi:hypothetical protein